jgi:hypothetical protein
MNERKLSKIRKIDLGDRQSIRMNFRFSKEVLEALSWLSKRHGVPMKDVFHFAIDVLPTIEEAIDALISVDEQIEFKKVEEKTIRRTVVITKKTLDYLNKLSQKSNLSRDDILNKAISHAKRFALSTDEASISAYKEAFDLIDSFYLEAQGVEFKLRELLGDDNLIVNDFGLGVTMIMNAYMKIEEEIKQRGDEPK